MNERKRVTPNSPADIAIRQEIERQNEALEKLDPQILTIKKRATEIQRDTEVHQEDLELEFTETKGSFTREEFEARMIKRAEEVHKKVAALEKDSRSSCKDLAFDSPGGSAWLLNHPNH